MKAKSDPHNDIYGPGNDDYGRNRPLIPDVQTQMDESLRYIQKVVNNIKDVDKSKVLTNDELLQLFHKSLEGTPLEYSSNLNPFDMFKYGFAAAQKTDGIILPSNEDIKAHSPYYGKSCNKHWFEGALFLKTWIISKYK